MATHSVVSSEYSIATILRRTASSRPSFLRDKKIKLRKLMVKRRSHWGGQMIKNHFLAGTSTFVPHGPLLAPHMCTRFTVPQRKNTVITAKQAACSLSLLENTQRTVNSHFSICHGIIITMRYHSVMQLYPLFLFVDIWGNKRDHSPKFMLKKRIKGMRKERSLSCGILLQSTQLEKQRE